MFHNIPLIFPARLSISSNEITLLLMNSHERGPSHLQPHLEFHFVDHRTGEECPQRVCCIRLQNDTKPNKSIAYE